MDGESYGEVSGEVMKQHLTIGKADKQGISAHFGEVLPPFSCKTFSVSAIICQRSSVKLSQMSPELVGDVS